MSFGSFNQDDNQPMAEINVTPLVDVMLVLLIVFMITMPVLTHSIPLQLPTVSEAEAKVEPKEPIRLAIDQEGQFFLGDEKYNLERLQQEMIAQKIKNQDVVLAIVADKTTAYENVVDALDVAQKAGITKVGFIGTTE